MKIIVNIGSGKHEGESLALRLEKLFHSQPGKNKMEWVKSGQELSETAQRVARENDSVVVAGGGDGTISAVAATLVGTNKTLGVLPLGTLNHFAKDLQIPMNLEEAVSIICEGHSTLVDVGEVNGRIFLNNSSVGFYSSVVRHREEQQAQFNRGKWMALLRALLAVARRFPVLELSLSADDKQLQRRTPFLFVGNNRYQLEKSEIGTRSCLDAGELSFFVAHQKKPSGLFLLALRAIFGRLHAAKDFDAFCTTAALIKTTQHHLMVAADGEIVRMETPLRYRVLPQALRVIVPRQKVR